jgi:hypothetical protein
MYRSRFALAGICCLLAAPALAGQRPPTPEKDRREVVELATSLETEPLSKKAKKNRQKVLDLIHAAPDLRVDPCRGVLGELLLVKKLEAQQLYVQLEFSTAKYLAEHPEAGGDREHAILEGLEGVLRTYDAMHHTNPALVIAFVDELVERRSRDELDDYVREALAECP